jgi:hypothetical protein
MGLGGSERINGRADSRRPAPTVGPGEEIEVMRAETTPTSN